MPETTRSNEWLTSVSVANITQSAGVPSTAYVFFTPATRDSTSPALTTSSRVIEAPTPLWSL